MDGFGVIERARARPATRHLPIIVVTGRDDVVAIERAFALGATSFLCKPINWNVFRHQVGYVLRVADGERELRDAKEQAERQTLLRARALSALEREITAAVGCITASPPPSPSALRTSAARLRSVLDRVKHASDILAGSIRCLARDRPLRRPRHGSDSGSARRLPRSIGGNRFERRGAVLRRLRSETLRPGADRSPHERAAFCAGGSGQLARGRRTARTACGSKWRIEDRASPSILLMRTSAARPQRRETTRGWDCSWPRRSLSSTADTSASCLSPAWELRSSSAFPAPLLPNLVNRRLTQYPGFMRRHYRTLER